MHIIKFMADFKRVNAIYLTPDLVLFRHPLCLYNLNTDQVLAEFEGIQGALDYEIERAPIRSIVDEMDEFWYPAIAGGGGSSSDAFNGKWPNAFGGSGEDHTTPDYPARMNVKVASASRTYEDMLKAFVDQHANSDEEHGITVDVNGFVSQYRHGNKGSISIVGGQGEMIIHNHPRDGYPIFSKEDLLNVAFSSERGIVAVSGTEGRQSNTKGYAGTYTFVKGNNFDAFGFTRAVRNATLHGKDYNNAVSKWLTSHQKKFGYKFTYEKNR